MFSIIMLGLTILFLIGSFFLTAMASAFRRVHRKDAKLELDQIGKGFFYRYFHRIFFPANEFEGLFFSILSAQFLIRFSYIVTFFIYLAGNEPYFFQSPVSLAFSLFFFILGAFFVGEYLPRIWGLHFTKMALKISAPFVSFWLFLTFPLNYLFLMIAKTLSRTVLDPSYEPLGKEEIINMIQKADFGKAFDMHDKELIESVVAFKERIVREVMVPRVDVFSLPADISIKEAANLLEKEGYSRTPVYRQTVDNIVGVLMYKDILKKYMEYENSGHDAKILEAPIETIQKNVLHTPETKKLSSLLQEFRKKQVHLAIVVDEYGGTEGIVTIEDILEEIVGEIADEYDQEEELFYTKAENEWIVDARMNILDVEEELEIKIPQEGEYDTISGYIFHTTGTIPPKGFLIHQDDFDLEVIQSNDRCVEKVRIKKPKRAIPI